MKTQAHQRYRGPNGEEYPGVTTVLNILSKPALVKWANNLGLRGIDSAKFTDEAAQVGTLVHEMIMASFTNQPCDTSDYSLNQIKKAERALTFFHKWRAVYNPKPILVEAQMVSQRYGYGGTIDLFTNLTVGTQTFRELVDFKSGSGPWPEQFAQCAAYLNLLRENCHNPENARLVKVPADPDSGDFAESQLLSLDKFFKLFLHCLAIYKLKVM